MPISLACPQCNRLYQLSDNLAGKKARCKDCGTTFQITMPKTVKPAPAIDLFDGLDDGEAVVRPAPPRSTTMKFGALTVTEGETGSKPRAPKPQTRVEIDHEGQEKFRRAGIGMIMFGAVSFILPLVGLQFRLLAFIPPAAQEIVGGFLVVVGIGSVLLSFAPHPSRWFVRGMIGVCTVIGLGLAWMFTSFKMQVPAGVDPAPRPAFVAQPNVPKSLPLVQQKMVIPQPRLPQPSPVPASIPAPVPVPVASIEPANANADELLYTLSNAQATRGNGPGMIFRELSFKVDYQAKGNVVAGSPLLWVIESNQTKTDRSMIGTKPQGGTLSGAIRVTGNDTGPFKTYLARDSFGIKGRSRVKVSNVVDMQWMGDQPAANTPGTPPGIPPNPGPSRFRRPFPNGMPGRPNFPTRPGGP